MWVYFCPICAGLDSGFDGYFSRTFSWLYDSRQSILEYSYARIPNRWNPSVAGEIIFIHSFKNTATVGYFKGYTISVYYYVDANFTLSLCDLLLVEWW